LQTGGVGGVIIEPHEIPESWAFTKMGEISTVIGGGTPKTKEPDNYEGGDISWLTPADLSGYTKKKIGHGSRFITEKGLSTSSARIMPAGTVLYTSRAPIGYVAIASNPICTNQGFKSFVLNDGILPDYVYWYPVLFVTVLDGTERLGKLVVKEIFSLCGMKKIEFVRRRMTKNVSMRTHCFLIHANEAMSSYFGLERMAERCQDTAKEKNCMHS
jgi:hypothetical protein